MTKRGCYGHLGCPRAFHPADRKVFRYGFGSALSVEESDTLYDKVDIPSRARPWFQAASANFVIHSQSKINTANQDSEPLLLISGLEHHAVPHVVTRPP